MKSKWFASFVCSSLFYCSAVYASAFEVKVDLIQDFPKYFVDMRNQSALRQILSAGEILGVVGAEPGAESALAEAKILFAVGNFRPYSARFAPQETLIFLTHVGVSGEVIATARYTASVENMTSSITFKVGEYTYTIMPATAPRPGTTPAVPLSFHFLYSSDKDFSSPLRAFFPR
jgi:hypothetical protein